MIAPYIEERYEEPMKTDWIRIVHITNNSNSKETCVKYVKLKSNSIISNKEELLDYFNINDEKVLTYDNFYFDPYPIYSHVHENELICQTNENGETICLTDHEILLLIRMNLLRIELLNDKELQEAFSSTTDENSLEIKEQFYPSMNMADNDVKHRIASSLRKYTKMTNVKAKRHRSLEINRSNLIRQNNFLDDIL
ncbi:hypothetical protein SNEBB_004684 [Seison nebaliae]|nr:hypothetical protein SNEBB_004684 [Seison nebaliae]